MTSAEQIRAWVEEGERLEKEATEGPWYWVQRKGHGADTFLYSRNDLVYNAECQYIAMNGSGDANCDFIAAARADLPRARRALDRLTALVALRGIFHDEQKDSTDEVLAEVAAILRGEEP